MVKRKVAWEFYIISAFITLLILFVGFYFGITLSREKIQELQDELDNLKLRQEDLTLELTLLALNKNISCDAIGFELEKVIGDAADLGDRVTIYEITEKVKDESFYNLKKDYTLILVRYWTYLEEMKKSCNRTDVVTILYFYSNTNCQNCQGQGVVLTNLKQTYPQNIMVFALDYDIDLNIISLLKKNYNVSSVPSLVINGKVYGGLITIERLRQIVCTEHGLCG